MPAQFLADRAETRRNLLEATKAGAYTVPQVLALVQACVVTGGNDFISGQLMEAKGELQLAVKLLDWLEKKKNQRVQVVSDLGSA